VLWAGSASLRCAFGLRINGDGSCSGGEDLGGDVVLPFGRAYVRRALDEAGERGGVEWGTGRAATIKAGHLRWIRMAQERHRYAALEEKRKEENFGDIQEPR
jgi:hypothetical protein